MQVIGVVIAVAVAGAAVLVHDATSIPKISAGGSTATDQPDRPAARVRSLRGSRARAAGRPLAWAVQSFSTTKSHLATMSRPSGAQRIRPSPVASTARSSKLTFWPGRSTAGGFGWPGTNAGR